MNFAALCGARVRLDREWYNRRVISERNEHARSLFEGIADNYDRPAELLSLGQYHRWRRRAVERLPIEHGSVVLDVACGTGLVARELARHRRARVVGLDLTLAMLRHAGGPGMSFVVGRAEQLPFPDAAFDGLVFTYLLRYVDDPAATLAELVRVLRPGGAMASVEFGVPRRGPLRAVWSLHARHLVPVLSTAFDERLVGRGEVPGSKHRCLQRALASIRARRALARRGHASRRYAPNDAGRGGGHNRHQGGVVTEPPENNETDHAPPAFYAPGSGRWRDYVTLLHPPYTLWHLSYVCIGWASSPRVAAERLIPLLAAERLIPLLAAFFLAVGVGAHALDELNGRPLRTAIPTPALIAAAVTSIGAAIAIGVFQAAATSWSVLWFVAFGGAVVVAYNLELFGGRMHSDIWFALAWGAFPALTASWASALAFNALGCS
jgi:ubiquinone/menaquinone biosynthesis methyltransferase